MSYIQGVDKVVVSVALLVGLLLVCIPTYFSVRLYREAKCNEHGFTSARIYPNFTTYCIKRQDQTDLVVPYNKVTN